MTSALPWITLLTFSQMVPKIDEKSTSGATVSWVAKGRLLLWVGWPVVERGRAAGTPSR